MEKRRGPSAGDRKSPDLLQNGTAIRCLREKDGWSVRALADRAGISQAALSYIELEDRSASPHVLNRIARALCVPEAAIRRNPPRARTNRTEGPGAEAVA